MILTGTCVDSSTQAAQLCLQYPGLLYSTAGIHPHDASTADHQALEAITQLCQLDCVKAIGETGLDFNRNFSTPEQQIASFEAHLMLAQRSELPLFLHERDAYDTQAAMLREHQQALGKVVIHCFTGSRQQLNDWLDLGCYIGITGWVCDERRGNMLREAVIDIPNDRLLIETDAPFLIPRDIPKQQLTIPKPRRNEPCLLPHILETIAHCRQQDIQELGAFTRANAISFFDLPTANSQMSQKTN